MRERDYVVLDPLLAEHHGRIPPESRRLRPLHRRALERGAQLLVCTSAGATYYVARDDRSGSVRGLVRPSDDSTVAKYTFTPFGALVPSLSVDTVPNVLKFAAREFDSETGLYYFRNRYYDPQVGRFVSEDRAGLSGGINLYSIGRNDPVNARDPYGLNPIPQLPTVYTTATACEWITNPYACDVSGWTQWWNGLGSAGPGASPALPGGPGGGPVTSSNNAQESPEAAPPPARTPRACFAANTAWLTSATSQLIGAGGLAASVGSAISGLIARSAGAETVAAGTTDLDLFFGVPGTSSSLIEGGIAAINQGAATVRAGTLLLRGGVDALVAGAGFLASYAATTYLICSISPSYGQ